MPVEKTNFTVGIVVANGDKEEMLLNQTIPPGILLKDTTLFNILFFCDYPGCGCGGRKSSLKGRHPWFLKAGETW